MSGLAAEMRTLAEGLERVAWLYQLSPTDKPSEVRLSAAWLRREADVLDKPIPVGGAAE